MIAGPALITFVGSFGDTPLAKLVERSHYAIALDLVEAAQASGAFDACIVVTESEDLARALPVGTIIEAAQQPFHFGTQLQGVVQRYGLQKPLYISRGGLPFLDTDRLTDIANRLHADRTIVTNNPFSADLVGWSPGDAINRVPPPPIDNGIPRLLNRTLDLPIDALPRDAVTQFDVDTPADLLVLALHPATGRHTREYVESLKLDTAPMYAAMQHLTRQESEVLVAGRVSSALWAQLERESACRVRLFAEERGMKADGREAAGKVRSLLGMYLEAVGPERCIRDLAQLGDAAFIDSRVLFAHLRLNLSAEDRFRSDLGLAEEIDDPVAAAITKAARDAAIPIVLGGHSMVAGGLFALLDAAWNERDEPSR